MTEPDKNEDRSSRRRVIFLGLVLLAFGTWFFVLRSPSRDTPKAGDSHGAAQYWTCGMHPWVILPEPGPCPICGMDLVPLDPKKFTGEISCMIMDSGEMVCN